MLLVAALALPMHAAADATPAPAPANKTPHVVLETSLGTIELELDAAKAPITVDNFLQYVKSGFYDGLIFHRVIPGFMIQGGGFTPDMQEKATRAPIKNESSNGLSNVHYSIAMARLPSPDSASAQFFINVANNGSLDYPRAQGSGYAVFGKVVSGMNVVDKIAAVSTTSHGPYQNVPMQAVVIKKATVK
jgi:peptidyl-prolyl cis-trans isomerase A (cyclophilin A)/peptidyl-prolyl cis-trans isomerase B (cyclophilin B)